MDAETIDKMICAEIPDEYHRKREFDKDGNTKLDDNGNIVYDPELDKKRKKNRQEWEHNLQTGEKSSL